MESGRDMLSDLLGPLEDPLQDDSLVRSSDHDSSLVSVQRQILCGVRELLAFSVNFKTFFGGCFRAKPERV
eukprot:15451751-Alexandrium_andersonii.AAC.1